MSKKFLTHIDLGKNELQNGVVQNLASAPSSPVKGQIYYDTTLNKFGVWNNSAWIYLGGSTASDVANTPAGNIGATDVQGAINELDTEKENVSNKATDFSVLNNTKYPTTQAVKTLVDSVLGANDAMVFKGVIDASGNPNYPAGDAGHTYKISVAGKIGGASGLNVQVGDTIVCSVDGSVAGNQATVGANWFVIQTNLEFASQAETEAKSDNTKAVTPADLVNFPIKKTFTIGNGSATSIACSHALGNKDVVVSVRQISDDAEVLCDIVQTSTSVTTLSFAVAPTTNSLRVVIIG